LRWGYNTNGFAHHRIEDALAILAELGYQAVAITLEHDLLHPPDRRGVSGCVRKLAPILERTGLTPTIETGARFILDPRHKHQPTMISRDHSERERRIEFLKAAVDVAAELRAESVSLWSGAADDNADDKTCFERLIVSLHDVCEHAAGRGVRIAFEPEPGMFVATMAGFSRLHDQLAHPNLGLTLDVGHVHCLADGRLADHAAHWRERLWNVHIEDMRRGVHEHLMFGDGEIEFADTISALRSIEYAGPVHVELSRHSHDAVNVARQALDFLRRTARADKT
jgi:L-ribulose-5-phosphate 3-epimerase